MSVIAVTKEYYDDGGTVSELQDLHSIVAAAPATVLQFANSGDMLLVLTNVNAASRTATVSAVADPKGRGGSTVGDKTYTIPAGDGAAAAGEAFCLIPFLNPSLFNASGMVTVTLSSITDVSYALIRLRKRP